VIFCIISRIIWVQSIRRYWRTFAGIDPASADRARAFLSTIIETDYYPLWELENPTSAELSKLLENSYRAVNIAFIHEWTLLAEQLGIDLYTAIESIRVRKGTHDNMRFPGFGVGGYCLTKDSLLAQWSCNKLSGKDAILGMTLEALNINYHMPLHALDLLASLSEGGLQGKRILICGITYIADVADTRNSAAELIVCELISAGSKVSVHDPCAMKWIENPSVPFFRELNAALKDIDGILFTVPHQSYKNIIPEDLLCQLSMPVFIVDAHNVLTDETAQKLNKGGCRILGVGKGHWRRRGYHLYHG
jgi:nucleotide sugar dehydrogenase